jgi:glutamine synthetase
MKSWTIKDCGFILGKATQEELARYNITEKLPGSMTEVIRACKDDEMFREKFRGVFMDRLITRRTWEENSLRRTNEKDRGLHLGSMF